MDGIVGRRVLRCSRGHLYTSSEGARILLSAHFGPYRFTRCPVDGRWGFMSNVNARDLTEAEQAEAAQHRF
jgi:hypothetical protein